MAFYAETADALTPCTDNNWMLLLIDADNDPSTGWYGYDYLINKRIKNDQTTTLMRYDSAKGDWTEVADLPMRYAGNQLEVSVPRIARTRRRPFSCSISSGATTGRPERSDLAVPERGHGSEPPVQLPLHLEQIDGKKLPPQKAGLFFQSIIIFVIFAGENQTETQHRGNCLVVALLQKVEFRLPPCISECLTINRKSL